MLRGHLVFVKKYRRRAFTDAMLTCCGDAIRTVCADLRIELVEFSGEADHVQLLLAYPPTLEISQPVQRLRGGNAHAARREYTVGCVCARMHDHHSSPSYIAVSCQGAPLTIIKQYIHG